MALFNDIVNNAAAGVSNFLGLTKKVDTPTVTTAGPKPIQQVVNKTPAIATAPSNALELQLLQAQIAAIKAQAAATPRLPTLNTADARAKAQSTAAAAVNPVYQDKLNNQLERYALQRSQQTAETNANKLASDTSLSQTREDIGTDRTRTTEDTQSAIDKSLYNEDQFQQTEGSQFDVANREARTAVGASGLTESGLGQQGLETMTDERNRASEAQLKDFTDQRATQELFKTRTFEDLGTKENRSIELNDVTKGNLDRQLNDYIAMQAQDERDFRLDNEAQRQDALFGATNQQYSTDIQTWLAGLKAAGWRDQDIALAASVYK